ncbi:hypothetical protein [Acidimangrovimonas pyrenivorans]|uniref:Uncharacterized protein n=1 Tax=Acidimangrovimonas pyrenivorans TaxID=2030798 RepID=A0ABV7ADB3_9RHOB
MTVIDTLNSKISADPGAFMALSWILMKQEQLGRQGEDLLAFGAELLRAYEGDDSDEAETVSRTYDRLFRVISDYFTEDPEDACELQARIVSK